MIRRWLARRREPRGPATHHRIGLPFGVPAESFIDVEHYPRPPGWWEERPGIRLRLDGGAELRVRLFGPPPLPSEVEPKTTEEP